MFLFDNRCIWCLEKKIIQLLFLLAHNSSDFFMKSWQSNNLALKSDFNLLRLSVCPVLTFEFQ